MIRKNELNRSDTVQMETINQAGMVYRNLAAWMRAYIISTIQGLSDQAQIRQRLSQIPMEYVNFMRSYFGDDIANTYNTLFSDYIAFVELLIDAQKRDDDNAVNGYMEQIHHNLHHTAAILSQINPFWQESEWRALFFRYLLLTIDETNALIAGDNTKSADIYETLLSVAMKMADYFSSGMQQYITAQNQA
ncbi:MAG: hypothetical protein K0R19_172 [Bacillota bacterium]|jgi:hypothetical protein|nr:hypothetical protein [Bacillota bacterium]